MNNYNVDQGRAPVNGGTRFKSSRFLGSWLGDLVQPEQSISELALVNAFLQVVSEDVSLENFLELLWSTFLSPALLTTLVTVALEVLVPQDMKWGRSSPRLQLLVAHLVAMRSLTLFRKAASKEKPPKWACRLARLLHPGFLDGLLEWSSAFCLWFRGLLSGGLGGAVYLLWCKSGLYIGKALLTRQCGIPGLPARLCEHLRGILRPESFEGARTRYKFFRAVGILSVYWFPAAAFCTEALTYVAEKVAIAMEDPEVNRAEVETWSAEVSKGSTLRERKKPRGRPYAWRRRRAKKDAAQTDSIWSLPLVQNQLVEKRNPLPLEDVFALQLPFARLYTLHLQALSLGELSCGPLNIFEKVHRVLLYMFLASTTTLARLPSNFTREMAAEFLYELASGVHVVASPFKRFRIGRKLDSMLVSYGLPPRVVKPLVVPSQLWFMKGAFAKASFECISRIGSPAARRWVREHFRMVRGAAKRWRSAFSANKACQAVKREELRQLSPSQWHGLLRLGSLKKLPGVWRLPLWPEQSRIHSWLLNTWKRWAKPRVQKQTFYKTTALLQRRMRDRLPQTIPPAWAQIEAGMCASVSAGGSSVITGDDKDSNIAWGLCAKEMVAYLLSTLLRDASWTLTSVPLQEAKVFEIAKAMLALPHWLRRRAPAFQKVRVPHLFPLVKSSCFDPGGRRTCTKPNHSCWRRVVDSSSLPWRSGWKVISRATRGIIINGGGSQEVFDQKLLGQEVWESFERLTAPCLGVCWRCGVQMQRLTIVTGDVDQAFEACSPEEVGKAFHHFRQQFGKNTGTNWIYVAKGRRYQVNPCKQSFGGAGYTLSTDTVLSALVVYCMLTLVALGDIVFALDGLAIGGLCSSSCVALVLGFCEVLWLAGGYKPAFVDEPFEFHGWPVETTLVWKRFVDDVLAISQCFCPSCLYAFVSGAYNVPLKPVSGFNGESEHVWTDIVVTSQNQWGLAMFPKNPNRGWLFGLETQRSRTTFLPWFGSLPCSYSSLRSTLFSRMVRSYHLMLPVNVQATRVLEDVLELCLLGYPKALIRKIVHSLPACPPALLARRVVRQWLAFPEVSASAVFVPMSGRELERRYPAAPPPPFPPIPPSGDSRGHGGPERRNQWEDRRGQGQWESRTYRQGRNGQRKGSDKTRKKRDSSGDSSSTSLATRQSKKVAKAAEYLYKHSPEHRQIFEEKAKESKEVELRAQGQALANALHAPLQHTLQAITQAAGIPQFPLPGSAPSTGANPAQVPAGANPAQFPSGANPAQFPSGANLAQFPSGSVFPQQVAPTPAPHQQVSPAPSVVQPQQVVPQPPPGIQEFQRKWLEAELGHKVKIHGNTQPQLVSEVKAYISSGRAAGAMVKKFLERHCSTSALPRTNEGKAEKVVKVILGQ